MQLVYKKPTTRRFGPVVPLPMTPLPVAKMAKHTPTQLTKDELEQRHDQNWLRRLEASPKATITKKDCRIFFGLGDPATYQELRHTIERLAVQMGYFSEDGIRLKFFEYGEKLQLGLQALEHSRDSLPGTIALHQKMTERLVECFLDYFRDTRAGARQKRASPTSQDGTVIPLYFCSRPPKRRNSAQLRWKDSPYQPRGRKHASSPQLTTEFYSPLAGPSPSPLLLPATGKSLPASPGSESEGLYPPPYYSLSPVTPPSALTTFPAVSQPATALGSPATDGWPVLQPSMMVPTSYPETSAALDFPPALPTTAYEFSCSPQTAMADGNAIEMLGAGYHPGWLATPATAAGSSSSILLPDGPIGSYQPTPTGYVIGTTAVEPDGEHDDCDWPAEPIFTNPFVEAGFGHGSQQATPVVAGSADATTWAAENWG